MEERALARIMKEFVAGRYDILLSTVIIENGLDIPNVNTLIVFRADTMGLSQLYQLRGRVGRSPEQAYAYLFIPPFRQIKENSLRRLRALEQYTELGSGFQIAMRDLEIRGAGAVLGTRQHGFIAAVGFELYCRLLKEAIDEIKGLPAAKETADVKVDLPLEAYLPREYILDGPTRIALYQEFSAATTPGEIEELAHTLSDRFGPLPQQANALLLAMKIKVYAKTLGASRVSLAPAHHVNLLFDGDDPAVAATVPAIIAASHRPCEVQYAKPLNVKISLTGPGVFNRAVETAAVLEGISAALTKNANT